MSITQKSILVEFTRTLYDSDISSLPPKKELLMFISKNSSDKTLSNASRKSSVTRPSTLPGAVFNQDLCRCRIFNRGDPKQCSSKKVDGDFCKKHSTQMTDLGGTPYGFYDEDRPTEFLCDGKNHSEGDTIRWKDLKKKKEKSKKKELPQELQDLKKEYQEKVGRKPGGPKANDIDWLKSKISDSESESDSEKTEIQEWKIKYEEKLGKKPRGPKTNDIVWLKSKIDEKEELEQSQIPQKFTFEGVEYTKSQNEDGVWIVEDSDENAVGEWKDEKIEWEDECWEEMHKDHDDYSETEE